MSHTVRVSAVWIFRVVVCIAALRRVKVQDHTHTAGAGLGIIDKPQRRQYIGPEPFQTALGLLPVVLQTPDMVRAFLGLQPLLEPGQIAADAEIQGHDIVSLYFRVRCYLAWLQQRLEAEKRPDHIRGLEYHRQETERRLEWLRPYVLPALRFVDDAKTRARCVRMVLDFDPSERCDTYDDPEYPDSTDPYCMAHQYNPELIPVLCDLPRDVFTDVEMCIRDSR